MDDALAALADPLLDGQQRAGPLHPQRVPGLDQPVHVSRPPPRPGEAGQQQRDRGVVPAAVGGGAALRPAGHLLPEPVAVVAGGELGQVPAHAGLPGLVGLGVAVPVGGEQQRRQRHLAQVVRAGPERRQRVRLAQAGGPPPVEPVIARDGGEGAAVGPDGEHVAVADLRAHQPPAGDHGDEQGGAVGDQGRVVREAEDELLLLRVGPRPELIGDGGAPAGQCCLGHLLAGQRGLLVSGGVRGQPRGRAGRHLAGDVDGQRGPVGAAEVADVPVPVGDRGDDAARARPGWPPRPGWARRWPGGPIPGRWP